MRVDKSNLTTEMERIFSASKEDLYDAHIDPEIVKKWWGPKKYEVTIEKFEAKEGGAWRISNKGINDKGEVDEYSFYGDFKKLDRPNSISWSFNFEPIGPGHTITETIYFESAGEGKTNIRTHSHYSNLQDLEGMISSGMEAGAMESWDRLAEVVEASK